MKFTLAHTNINVHNLNISLAFYQKALGMELVKRHKASDESFELAFISDSTSTHQIELTWLRDKEAPYELGDNETHIAFTVDDFEEAHALHGEMGCICYENKAMGIYFIEDPDGYWFEIIPLKRMSI